jgi:hypothetical protein
MGRKREEKQVEEEEDRLLEQYDEIEDDRAIVFQ